MDLNSSNPKGRRFVPHLFFNPLAICLRSSVPFWNPEIVVTVLPFLPFFSRLIRMIPSDFILLWNFVFLALHEQLLVGFPQSGQALPDSVEYTSLALSTINTLSEPAIALKRHWLSWTQHQIRITQYIKCLPIPSAAALILLPQI